MNMRYNFWYCFDDFSVSGAIRRSAGSRLDAELKAIGGCNPGEAKTTSGMTFNLLSLKTFYSVSI